MTSTEPLTRVIFRVFRAHPREVIALFPDVPGTNAPGTCLSYVHNGQHGAADLLGLMYSGTRPASPEEYASLKRELERPPYEYKLRVIKRTPKDSAGIREAEIRRTRS
jgi:hypothetical protein